MTINTIVAYAENELAPEYVNWTNLGRLEDGEIFDDYDNDEELPAEAYADIMSAITR